MEGEEVGGKTNTSQNVLKKVFTLFFVLSLCPKIFSVCFFFDFDSILIFAENLLPKLLFVVEFSLVSYYFCCWYFKAKLNKKGR